VVNKSLLFPQEEKKRRQIADNGLEGIWQNMGKRRIKAGPLLETRVYDSTIEIGENQREAGIMDTPVRDLTGKTIVKGTTPRMTEQQRADQLVNRVYGNVRVEHPAVTIELVRQVVKERRAAGTMDATITRCVD